jgi:diguanylate cyclase (GGDEF)-like protein
VSNTKRLTDTFTTYSFLSVLLVLILFVLFIYPAPEGILYSGLRILLILLVGVLFYQSLQPSRKITEVEKRIHYTNSQSTTSSDPLSAIQRDDEDLIEDLLVSTTHFLENVFPNFTSGIYLANLSGTELVLRRETGKTSQFTEALDPDDENIRQILSSSETNVLLPGDEDSQYDILINVSEPQLSQGAILSVPIQYEGSIKGLLAIYADRFDKLENRDKILLKNHANQIGNHLSLLTGRAKLFAINKFGRNFRNLVGELDLTRSKEEMLSALVQFCEAEFSFDKLSIALLDHISPGKAVIAGNSGFTMDYGVGDDVEYSGTHLEKALSKRETLVINSRDEIATEGRFTVGDIEEFNFQSYIAVPINNQHGVQGALVLESFTSSHFDDSNRELLEIVASELGILIDWWDTFGNIRETASRDGLTGLFNHRVFVERFEDELQRAKRFGESIVLMILDLDKFKRINDTYGHLYGDYVLKTTAKLLKESVRTIDIVARYGGEEFAVILINAQKDTTMPTMKRTVNSIASYEFEEDGITERMTISAGAAEFPSDGDNLRDLIVAADEAMYEVKRKGGNDVGLSDKGSI